MFITTTTTNVLSTEEDNRPLIERLEEKPRYQAAMAILNYVVYTEKVQEAMALAAQNSPFC